MEINKSDGSVPFPCRVWFVLAFMAENTAVDSPKNVRKPQSVKHINIKPSGFYNRGNQMILTV